MKVTAPFDAHVLELAELDLVDDPLNPDAGQVKEGHVYDVPSELGERLVAQGWKSARSIAAKKAAKARTAPAKKKAADVPVVAPEATPDADPAPVKNP